MGDHTRPVVPNRVELYRGKDGWAPSRFCKERKESLNLRYLEVFAGTHSAVTFINAQGLDICSNNPNAVPRDKAVWVDQNRSSNSRTIFFYGNRMLKESNELPSDKSLTGLCTLFEDGQGHTKLQVWVVNYHLSGIVIIKLMGKSLVLNSNDTRRGKHVPPYTNFDNDKTIKIDINQKPAGDIINIVETHCPLIHLVINAHGGDNVIEIGNYFNLTNKGLWDRLKGKVKYIWLMNCGVGNKQELPTEIAKRAEAWVTAPAWVAPFRPGNLGKYNIDLTIGSTYKHWNKDGVTDQNLFFRSARHRTDSPDLGETSLYFNVVKEEIGRK